MKKILLLSFVLGGIILWDYASQAATKGSLEDQKGKSTSVQNTVEHPNKKYFQSLAAQKHPVGCNNYAVVCRSEGGEENLRIARENFKFAADQNLPEAQHNYSSMCYNGEGGPQDFEEAANYAQKAADLGYAWAQYNFALMRDKGEGGPTDLNITRKYLRLAAAQGHIKAQQKYARMCRKGLGGPVDLDEAAKYSK